MTFPAALTVTFRPTPQASFENAFVLGDANQGVLGTNVLGTSAEPAVDITNEVRQVSIRRGRDRQFDTYLSGTCTIELIDLNGDWNPNNSDGPYFGELKSGRQVRVSATYENELQLLFSGYVRNYRWRFNKELNANLVTINASDGFRILDRGTITTVNGSSDGDTAAERINQILDEAKWPPTLRNISDGGVLVQANPTDRRSPLAALQQVETTELGALFMETDGALTFKTREQQFFDSLAAPTVFTDDPSPVGPVVTYTGVEIALDDDEIINFVSAERIGGTVQEIENAESVNEFFTRSRSYTELLHQNDLGALSLANVVVSNRSQPTLEIRSVTLEMLSDDTQRLTAGLSLQIGDPIVVERFAVGGPISSSLTVQGIQHNINLNAWFTTFSTAETLSSTLFVLGSSQFGVLGQSTL